MLTVQPSRCRLESVNEERRVTQFAVGCGYFFIFHFFSLCIGREKRLCLRCSATGARVASVFLRCEKNVQP